MKIHSALKSNKVLFGIYSKGKIKFTNGSALNYSSISDIRVGRDKSVLDRNFRKILMSWKFLFTIP